MTVLRTSVLVLAFAFVACSAAHAQSFGVVAGVNRSDVSFASGPSLDVAPQVGIAAGGFVSFHLPWNLDAQIDALFVERRVEIENVVKDRLRYFEVPILASCGLGEWGAFRVKAQGGVDLGFLLSAQEEVGSIREDIGEAIESTDVAIAVGGSVEWRSRLSVGVRYLHGLSDLYTAPDFEAKQRSLQVLVAFRLR